LGNTYDTLDFVKYSPEEPNYGEVFAQLRADDLFQKDRDYQLRVVVAGESFTCFIDGESVLTGTDDSYSYGGVGLRARCADVHFDDFKVEDAIISDVELPEPLSPDLLAWWKLDEGSGTVVSDSSGYNYRGTIHGANWMSYMGTTSLNFDGVSDYVSLPPLRLTNLDSLTVVAWINSDLTDVGFIMYHGNLGEFDLGVGDLGESTQHLNIKPDHASFAVKLAGHGWHGVQASPMKPNTWHQIVGVWKNGDSVKIYVDGFLAGENDDIPSGRLYNPGSSFPSSLGIYSQDRFGQQDFFEGQISNVMVFNKVLTASELIALYDNVTLPTVARPVLDVSCKSLASSSGFAVEIDGELTLGETSVSGAPVLLSYSVNGGKSWKDLTMVYTASDGAYSVTWNPSVTGIYMIKAVYEGDTDHLGTTAAVNLSVMQQADHNIFSVSSNSTVTSLTFNSTTSELSFDVSGNSGTKGYVECTIAKSLVSNAKNIRLFLDGTPIDYELTSTSDTWIVYFTYTHSSHNIRISLPQNTDVFVPLEGNGYWTWIVVAISIITVGTSLLVYFKKHKN
jgi:hypothetical protein